MLKLKAFYIILIFIFAPVFGAHAQQGGFIEVVSGKTQAFRASDYTDSETDTITLQVSVVSSIQEVRTPQVLISKQRDGFSCEVEVMRRLESKSLDSGEKIQEIYAIILSWYPGNDWSSCTLEVIHPSLDNNSVVLYVEGDMRGPLGLLTQKNQ